MTPAIISLKKATIAHTVHSYKHDPKHTSFGLEAAEKLGVAPERVFKTLVASIDGKDLVVAIIPVAQQLCMKRLAEAVNGKRAQMADKQLVQRVTGYVLGGVSPLGQRKQLTTVIDCTAQLLESMFVSAGRRGLEVELTPADLATTTKATFASITT